MASTLIISEKADAGRRIAFFLSEGKAKQKRSKGLNYIEFENESGNYYVVPLSGHIVELDFPKALKDWRFDTLEKLIGSVLDRNVKNRTAYESLKQMSKTVDSVVVATDYDREGELIGTEALDIIHDGNSFNGKIYRAKFSALTGKEIRDAFNNYISVDYNLSDSARAREEIDLYWGAVLTRFFSLVSGRIGKDFLSIGRVQTPTLAIVIKRDEEIDNFVPETFYEIKVDFLKDGVFTGVHEEGRIFDRKRADEIFKKIDGKDGEVEKFEDVEERIYKPSPFNTTEFMREASKVGVMPGKAMKIAEKLYIKGFISYPRTDNTVYQKSINLKAIAEKFRKGYFEKESSMVLEQEFIRPSRGKMQANDHPPIYPTEYAEKAKLRDDEWRVYELIVRRFLATIYREGKRGVKSATIDISGEKFLTQGQRILDPGWLAIYPYRKIQETYHPDLEVGEKVKGERWRMEEEQTKPPSRYDMGSLIKEMERLNLGTKSTRHDIIEKLQGRGFIEGNPVRGTPLGRSLIKSVMSVDSKISEPDMTAELEGFMDEIASGKREMSDVVTVSRSMLSNVLKDLYENRDRITETIKTALETGKSIGKCPEHGDDISAIKIRDSIRFKCAHKGCSIDYYAKIRGLIKESEKNCPVCSLPVVMIIRRGQSPEEVCIKTTCEFNTKRRNVGKCPADGGILMIRQSRYGKRFLGCSKFPECRQTYPLPQKGEITFSGAVCPHCGAPILTVNGGNYRKDFCPKMDCEFNGKKKTVKKKESGEKTTTVKRRTTSKKTTAKGVKKRVAKKATP